MFKWVSKLLSIFKKKNTDILICEKEENENSSMLSTEFSNEKINQSNQIVFHEPIPNEELTHNIHNDESLIENANTDNIVDDIIDENHTTNNNFREVIKYLEDDPSKPDTYEETYFEFSQEEITDILNNIRPLIKNINCDKDYIDFCNSIINCEAKRLKTFAKTSDDFKTISISFTQSPSFNNSISDFITNNVFLKIKNTIESLNEKYDISSDHGTIFISKK